MTIGRKLDRDWTKPIRYPDAELARSQRRTLRHSQACHHAKGNTPNRQGRLLTGEHCTGPVTRIL